MMFARIVLGVSALVFAATGIACFIRPARIASVVGMALENTLATSDFRAVYGGLEIGFAIFLAWAARSAVKPGLVAHVAVFAGILTGRIASLALDGRPEPPGLMIAAVEAVALAAGVAALVVLRSVRPD